MIKKISDEIIKRSKNTEVFIVGLSGPDASGKTQMSKKLIKELQNRGVNIICIPSDWFHYPKAHRRAAKGQPREQFLYNTINFDRLIQEALEPVRKKAGEIKFTHFNVDTDKGVEETMKLQYPLVLLIEGIFLFQPKLVDYFDFKVYLDVDPDETINRAINRDAYRFGEADEVTKRYESKYNKGQTLHRKLHKPLELADWVIENNDWKAPSKKF
jgi:uridine kinase